MPAHLTSSFASAAAGQNTNRTGRADGRGGSGSDWQRRDGRPANGTLTLRRSSTTPVSHSSQTPVPPEIPPQQPNVDMVPMEPVSPKRYSKDALLNLWHGRQPEGEPRHLFMDGWNPSQVNGGARAWGKVHENHVPQEPSACWNEQGGTIPIAFTDPSAEESELRSEDINSPLKPPTQKQDNANPTGINGAGRKASLSHGPTNTFGVISPTAPRPGTRRRETLESNSFSAGAVSSPTTANRPSRDEHWLSRKAVDLRDSEADEPDTTQPSRELPKLPIGSLTRANTSGSAGMSSIWSPTTPGTPGGGAFGNFAIGGSTIGDKRGAGAAGGSGGSRLAHLMQKDPPESPGRQGDGQNPLNQQSWRSRQRTDTDPFGDDIVSGSAALGGAQDNSSIGSAAPGGRVGAFDTPIKGSTSDFGMSGLNLGGNQQDDDGPLSPSETDPFRSPPAERHDEDDGIHKAMASFPYEQPSGFNPLQRGFGPGTVEGSDRSQTSSVGAKGFPVGNMSSWAAPGAPLAGTPDRERANFPGGPFPPSLFNAMGDIQPSNLGNLGNVWPNNGSIGRGSKLGSLFPAAMQAQMQPQPDHEGMGDPNADLRQMNPLGAIGRNTFGTPSRDTESPMRSNRGVFEELFPSSDPNRQAMYSDHSQAGSTVGASQSFTPVSGAPAVNVPLKGVRTMVMPDRMRWIYMDPSGVLQGPFTGLEMNDWYKANFFSPDLRVKRVEDNDFEPLGMLIRRIGNSREPFLVPQVGIAHGEANNAYPTPGGGGSVVPPLSGVFPSFGRTLTAEEQNNLERRKQEEQYMHAQQRDFALRQQQAMSRFQGQQPGLHHHSSAHSLQSQPSFGSIASPMVMPGQIPQQQPIGAAPPIGGPSAGFLGTPGEVPQGNATGAREPFQGGEVTGLSLADRQMLAAYQSNQQQIQTGGLGDIEASLRSGLPETDQLGDDPEGFRQRLQEFEGLRAQRDEAEQSGEVQQEVFAAEVEETPTTVEDPPVQLPSEPQPARKSAKGKKKYTEDITLSLTQQVQKTQAAAVAAAQTTEPGMPMPFPPPSSTTPLPAPTAQRLRSNLPEQYSRSQSNSPGDDAASSQPPPMAPWAKDPGHDAQKGPSLKEIQEAEARKAAKAEQAAAALKKAALEQETALLREREKQAAATTTAGLPASSTWAHGSPVANPSTWIKPTGTKMTTPGPSSGTSAASKKTLAEIQREEENRKLKAKEVAVQSGMTPNTSKSYANLAGKPGQPALPGTATPAVAPTGAGWATVGAGGKVKAPSVPGTQGRSASASNVKPIAAAPVKPYSRPGPGSSRPEPNAAMDEFRNWVNRELSRTANGIKDVPSLQVMLEAMPNDAQIIADAVYASSNTMAAGHFAEEYVRRKKLAEKGVAERQPTATEPKPVSAGGWSEVAKKTNPPAAPKEDDASMQASGFKMVPGRKKGKK